MKTSKNKKFSAPADAKNLSRIRDFAIKSGQKFGFNARQLNGLKLSLDEVCTNIMIDSEKSWGQVYTGCCPNGKNANNNI